MIPFVWLAFRFNHWNLVVWLQYFELYCDPFKINKKPFSPLLFCKQIKDYNQNGMRIIFVVNDIYRSDLRFVLNASQIDLWFKFAPPKSNPTKAITGPGVSIISIGKVKIFGCKDISIFFYFFEIFIREINVFSEER